MFTSSIRKVGPLAVSTALIFSLLLGSIGFIVFSGSSNSGDVSSWWGVVVNLIVIFVVSVLYLQIISLSLVRVDRNTVRRAFWSGLVIRLVFAAIFYLILYAINFHQQRGLYYDDESFYHSVGTLLSSSFSVRDVSPLSMVSLYYGRHWGNVPFDYVVGTLYYVWGNNPLIVRLWMSFIGACIVPLVYCFARYVFNNDALAKRAMWISVFFPTLILWSVAPLREIIVVFLGLLASLIAIMPLRWWFRIVLWMPTIAALTMFRTIHGIAIGILSLIVMLFPHQQAKKRSVVSNAIVLILFCFLIIWIGQTDTFANIINSDSIDNLIQRYTNISTEDKEQQIALDNVANGNTAITLILRTLRVMTLPNPFATIRDEFPTSILGFAEGVGWYMLLPMIIIGYLHLFKSVSISVSLLLLLPIVLLFYSATDAGSTWDPLRARLIVLPFFIILAAYGWQTYREHAQRFLFRFDFTRLVFYLSVGVLFILTTAVGVTQAFNVGYTSPLVFAPIIIYIMVTVFIIVRHS